MVHVKKKLHSGEQETAIVLKNHIRLSIKINFRPLNWKINRKFVPDL